MLLLLMATLVKVETSASSQQLIQLQARQNALLALMIAFGELQKHAGPDQRVTARADILGDDVAEGARFWTGVWDSSNPSAPPVWLVSGENPDPESVANANRLVGPESVGNRPQDFVFAPNRAIENQGAFSYWISDEGVKASIGIYDNWSELNITGYSNAADPRFRSPDTWRREYIRKSTGAIFDITDKLPAGSGFSHRSDENGLRTREMLKRAIFRNDLRLDPEVALPEDFLASRFHEFTFNAYFTLSNTLDGGLRQDLTHLRRVSDADQSTLNALYNEPTWEFITPALRDFVNYDRVINWDPTSTKPILTTEVRDNFMDESVSFSATPIVTELVWNAGFAVQNLSGGAGGNPTRDVLLYFYMIGEILNPFTLDLGLDNGSRAFPGDPSDVLIRISGLPNAQIRNVTQATETTIDLSNFVIATGINSFNDHAPGYMRPNFSPLGSFNWETGIAGSNDGQRRGVFAVKVGELPDIPDVRDDFEVVFEESTVTIEIRESNTNAIQNQADRRQWAYFLQANAPFPNAPIFNPNSEPAAITRIFQTIELQNWGGFSIYYDGNEDNERFVRGATNIRRTSAGAGALNDGITNFGIHAKFVDEWNDSISPTSTQLLDELFTFSDLRKRRIVIDMNNFEEGDGLFYDVADPRDMDRSNFTKSDDFFQGAEFGSDLNNRRARLFDLPIYEPVSIGALNHLLFEGFPYQPLGNTAGGRQPPTISGSGNGPDQSLNNFFDRYFFSTLPINAADWSPDMPLPNARIVASTIQTTPNSAVLESPRAAELLFTRGGFNINSTSQDAWASLLNPRAVTRLLYTRSMSATDNIFSSTRTATNLSRLFFSQPFGGDHQVHSTSPSFTPRFAAQSASLTTPIRTNGPHESFIQGFRELTFVQTEALAEAIVDEIRRFNEREGRPFLSLTEFLNEGVLQNAIDAVPSINSPGDSRIPTLAPAFFSAGSILNSIGSALFSRSDTFVIRAAGYAENALPGSRSGSAMIEARVQRLPSESSDWPETTRKMEIVNLRWIQP